MERAKKLAILAKMVIIMKYQREMITETEEEEVEQEANGSQRELGEGIRMRKIIHQGIAAVAEMM
jgi:hypothetical protein